MIRYLTAGESHGPGLMGILEGMPSNLPVDLELVNRELHRRQQGFGRGGRMRIEQDQVEVLSGIRAGKTLGSPIGFLLRNKDWQNWQDIMSQTQAHPGQEISRPRPGHADLSGALKYDFADMRNVLERSSARETAMRVAAGAFVKQLLSYFQIRIFSHVVQIGEIRINPEKVSDVLQSDRINQIADQSPVRCLDAQAAEEMINRIKQAKSQGDTLGGIIQVIIRNVPVGLGSHTHWDRKLDGQLAAALMSIQAIKGVEVGLGFRAAQLPGSQVHDEMFFKDGTVVRSGNNAGGIEGGMSNGQDIVLQIAMKPIPTLMKPLHSVDLKTGEPFLAHKERSDVTAVPAAAVIAEAVVAPVIANAFLEKFGADTVADIAANLEHYLKRIKRQQGGAHA